MGLTVASQSPISGEVFLRKIELQKLYDDIQLSLNPLSAGKFSYMWCVQQHITGEILKCLNPLSAGKFSYLKILSDLYFDGFVVTSQSPISGEVFLRDSKGEPKRATYVSLNPLSAGKFSYSSFVTLGISRGFKPISANLFSKTLFLLFTTIQNFENPKISSTYKCANLPQNVPFYVTCSGWRNQITLTFIQF